MENKVYNQLLLDVQKRFGSSIQKVSQLKILQERIAYTTKKHNTSLHFIHHLKNKRY